MSKFAVLNSPDRNNVISKQRIGLFECCSASFKYFVATDAYFRADYITIGNYDHHGKAECLKWLHCHLPGCSAYQFNRGLNFLSANTFMRFTIP